jgi:GntR family transcriptional regulator
MPMIRAHNPVPSGPLYRRVVARLTEKLAAGEWKSGEAIPSEARLAEQFVVSVGTIRKAIDELVAGKILVRQQGRGTFIATHSEDHFLYHFFHVVARDGVKRFPTVQTLSFRRARADAPVTERLRIMRGARVIRIQNLLRIEDRPVVLDDITLPVELFPGLTKDVFVDRLGTIYHLYQDRYGINVVRAVERLRAMLADVSAARALGVRTGTPLIEINRTAYTYHDQPVEIRRSLVNTERHEYLSDFGRQP